MESSVSRSRWRKRSQRDKPLLLFFLPASLLLLLLLFTVLLFSSYSELLRSLLPFPTPRHAVQTVDTRPPQCRPVSASGSSALTLGSGRFLWYAPHSGFSNQVAELRNAVLFAAILNRTLIVPPVLDHHAVALGSCPKFRVSPPSELRTTVWDHIIELVRAQRYVSMGDIVSLSSVEDPTVRMIDFRVFASMWCGLNMDRACFGTLCCATSGVGSLSSSFDQCRSLLSGLQGNVDPCVYAVQEDCRTTVWTYQQDNDGALDLFQPNKELQKKKKTSYVRKRRDIYKAFGPGSIADAAAVLSFGSLFSAPYRGSKLYIDIHEAPFDARIQSLLERLEFLPFAPEIVSAAKEFAINRIKVPFLCAQLRLLDGQFKNHWKTTFSALEQKLRSLQSGFKRENASVPVHVFIMTDLPIANWTGTYLADLAKDIDSYELHTLREDDGLVVQAAKRLMEAEHGLRSGFLPGDRGGTSKKRTCEPVLLPDILLYVEENVCSCASLGFVGTVGSTIAESIELMRKHNVCEL